MIKTQLKNIVNAANAGAILRFSQWDVPYKTAMRMKPLLRELNTVLTDYNESRVKMLIDVGAVYNQAIDEYEFPSPEIRKAFNEKFEDFVSVDIHLLGEPFKQKDFLSSMVTRGGDMQLLDFLIPDEEGEEVKTQTATP